MLLLSTFVLTHFDRLRWEFIVDSFKLLFFENATGES